MLIFFIVSAAIISVVINNEIKDTEYDYVWLDIFSGWVEDVNHQSIESLSRTDAGGFYSTSKFRNIKAIGGSKGDSFEGYMTFYTRLSGSRIPRHFCLEYVAYDEQYSTLEDVMNTDDKFKKVYFEIPEGTYNDADFDYENVDESGVEYEEY